MAQARLPSTTPSVTLTGLNGDELVFDNVFKVPKILLKR